MPVAQNHLRRVKFGCHDTRRNLPPVSSRKRGESNFLAKFEQAFFASEMPENAAGKHFAAGREFALDGFGRADLLFMAWTHKSPSEEPLSAKARERAIHRVAAALNLR